MPRRPSSKLKAFLRREIEKNKIKPPEDTPSDPKHTTKQTQNGTNRPGSPGEGDGHAPVALTREEQRSSSLLAVMPDHLTMTDESSTARELATGAPEKPENGIDKNGIDMAERFETGEKETVKRSHEQQQPLPYFEPLSSPRPSSIMSETLERINSLKEELRQHVEDAAPADPGQWETYERQRLSLVGAIGRLEHTLEGEKRKALIVDPTKRVPEPIHPSDKLRLQQAAGRVRKARLGTDESSKKKSKRPEILDEDLDGEERRRLGRRAKKGVFQPTGHWKYIKREKPKVEEPSKRKKKSEIAMESVFETMGIEHEGEESINNSIVIDGSRSAAGTKMTSTQRKAERNAQEKAEEARTPKLWEYIRKGGQMKKWKR